MADSIFLNYEHEFIFNTIIKILSEEKFTSLEKMKLINLNIEFQQMIKET